MKTTWFFYYSYFFSIIIQILYRSNIHSLIILSGIQWLLYKYIIFRLKA